MTRHRHHAVAGSQVGASGMANGHLRCDRERGDRHCEARGAHVLMACACGAVAVICGAATRLRWHEVVVR